MGRGADTRRRDLDGLRGYAAAAVVMFHVITASDDAIFPRVLIPTFQDMQSAVDVCLKLALSIFAGDAAVTLFFVLSGAVLFESLNRDPRPLNFVIRRAFRIYPALGVAVLFGAVVLWAADRPEPLWQIAADLTLLDKRIIGPAWTLQVELLAVPFILGAFWCSRRFGQVGIALAFLVTFLALKLPILNFAAILKPYILPFALGFATAGPVGASVARHLDGRGCLALLVIITFGRHLIPSVNLSNYTLQISCAVLVWALYHGRGGRLGAFLTSPMSQFFGRISYSMYLLNVPLLSFICPYIFNTNALFVGVPVGLAVIVLTVPLAWATERWVERPTIKFGNRLIRWRWRSSTAPAGAGERREGAR